MDWGGWWVGGSRENEGWVAERQVVLCAGVVWDADEPVDRSGIISITKVMPDSTDFLISSFRWKRYVQLLCRHRIKTRPRQQKAASTGPPYWLQVLIFDSAMCRLKAQSKIFMSLLTFALAQMAMGHWAQWADNHWADNILNHKPGTRVKQDACK